MKCRMKKLQPGDKVLSRSRGWCTVKLIDRLHIHLRPDSDENDSESFAISALDLSFIAGRWFCG